MRGRLAYVLTGPQEQCSLYLPSKWQGEDGGPDDIPAGRLTLRILQWVSWSLSVQRAGSNAAEVSSDIQGLEVCIAAKPEGC